MTPDQQWHWEQGAKFAHEGIKVLLTLNGGAAVALLTFAGHAGSPVMISRVGYALLAFGAGALCAVLTFLTAYLTQLEYGKDKTPKASRYHNASYVVFAGAIFCFIVGLYFAYTALPPSMRQ